MGLTKRELATVDETHQGRYIVSIQRLETGLWRLRIELDETRRQYELDTTRGGARTWRHMEDVVDFAVANCSRARNVYVEADDWKLQRVGKEEK